MPPNAPRGWLNQMQPKEYSARVDQRILELEAEIRLLKKSRNVSASTLAKLPTEVLARIFWEYRAQPGDYRAAPSRIPTGMKWIVVTHVCHHWREVALNYHALWTDINFRCKPQMTALMLSRSGKAKLFLCDTPSHPGFRDGELEKPERDSQRERPTCKSRDQQRPWVLRIDPLSMPTGSPRRHPSQALPVQVPREVGHLRQLLGSQRPPLLNIYQRSSPFRLFG